MQNETLTYEADGLTMKSQLFFEPGLEPRPAVLVFPDFFGIGEHSIDRARRLVGMGYVALAGDLHGEGLHLDDMQQAGGLLKPMQEDPAHTRARAVGALQALLTRPEVDPTLIAAIGFCFGGTMALELARAGTDVKAVVGFHSGLATAAPKSDARAIRGKVLVCIGADDPMIPPEQRAAFEDEMREGGVDWQMHLYGNTVHSFTSKEADSRNMPHAIRYSAAADARSWSAMRQLFGEVFG